MCVQVVQEYERAVIFRLGRLLQRGAKGPGEMSTTALQALSKITLLAVAMSCNALQSWHACRKLTNDAYVEDGIHCYPSGRQKAELTCSPVKLPGSPRLRIL